MKKRTFAAILAGLLVCGTMLTSCSDHIKDTNGEDNYDVVELTADDLIANGATIVPSDTKKVEEKDGMTTYSDENTSGVATVATFKASEELEAGTKGYST